MGRYSVSQEQPRLNKYGMQTYNTRDLIVREDIMGKAKELASLISTSEEVRHFQQAELKIKNHERVQGLIAMIKKKQKEIVAFESFGNKEMVAKIEHEIEVLQDDTDYSQYVPLNASMTGNIWKIFVEAGQIVKKGDTVAIIEAMKMELPVYADDDGIVKAIICRSGQTVHSGEPLVYME